MAQKNLHTNKQMSYIKAINKLSYLGIRPTKQRRILAKLLFENVDDITASEIQDEIEYSIVNYEPRVDLIDVTIHPNYDNYEFDAVIRYQIIGADVPSQELQFALQPTR